MKYIAYFTVIALTFGMCFLVDTLCKRLRGKRRGPNRVRPQKRTAAFGIILAFLGLSFAVGVRGHWLVVVGSALLLLLGGMLITVYFATGLTYDQAGFTYKTPFHRAKAYRYEDITGQNTLLTRAGVQVLLRVAGDEVQLYEAMEGLNDFFSTAYEGWLKARGLTREQCPPPNPAYYVWFPESDAP